MPCALRLEIFFEMWAYIGCLRVCENQHRFPHGQGPLSRLERNSRYHRTVLHSRIVSENGLGGLLTENEQEERNGPRLKSKTKTGAKRWHQSDREVGSEG